MENIIDLIEKLHSKNSRFAYNAMTLLQCISETSDEAYGFFDVFANMLANENSYIRNRGIILIACNAKWDKENKINKIIDEYLSHISDEKPITSRQCIKYLTMVAEYKPELRRQILNALSCADPSVYSDSMAPLVCNDIDKAVKQITSMK